ncbi:killer cell lectin-like receptor 2 [Peromyscus eremicus]|uniref:killer cell lectin-like receptor 2 n=1 Tax=Peromyscus eremicus TaxID=42410 RepID=UPI0027DAEE6C|nr:killer cell lectin-like receptor 2 [Peromyscus eremicus]
MSNQKVIYLNSRVFESSSESQNPIRPEETQGPREVGHKMALGILCLLLMMAISVWLIYIFQYKKEKYELQKSLNNLTQNYHILKNDNYLKEEILRNKSREYDDLKHQKEPDSLNRKQNRHCGKTKIILDCVQYTGKPVEGRLFCRGIKCYYFIMDNKCWSGSEQTCQDCSLSLLKIDNDDELKFLQSQLTTNRYWIGLKYNGSKGEWQWTGDGPSKLFADLYRLLPTAKEASLTKVENSPGLGHKHMY